MSRSRLSIWGITRVPAQYRSPGVAWMVTLESGRKSVWGDLPSAMLAKFFKGVWDT